MPAFGTHKTNVVDVAWDAGAQEKKVRLGEKRAYYAKIYAWYDPALDEANKGTYKFIHHEVNGDGDAGDAVTKACTSGIGVLNGGMGGTTIPKADRQGVWDHLAKHLRDAGKEPPPLNGEMQEGAPQSHGDTESMNLWRMASTEVWAIWQNALQRLLAAGFTPEARGNDLQALTRPGPKSGRVARIPIMGSLSKRDSFWSALFGGASYEGIVKAVREAAADESIGTILLDIESPGGTVSGVLDVAAEIRKARESKHVVALANGLMASAAYWIGSQADEIFSTPDALVGSIGVFSIHNDWSKFMERIGITPTYVHAGKYKVEGNPNQPLSDEARAQMQIIVDDAYEMFIADVAKGRNVTSASVRSDYGEGRVLTAKDAKAAGMIDRIAGVDETMRRLSGMKAELDSRVRGNDEVGNSLALKRRRLELLKKL